MKKILCFVLSVLFCFSMFLPSVMATDNVIEKEFEKIISFGKYPANSNDTKVYLLTVMESGYNGTGFDDDAGLYVYFYNPSRKSFENTSELNKIVFASDWDDSGVAVGYNKKIPLEFVGGLYDNLYIKAKVKASPITLCRINSDGRHYEISEIELYEDGDYNADAYGVGYDFVFSGSGESLNCKRTSFLTLELDVKATSYLTGDSAKGKHYSNLISSVYFSVPKEIEAKYGRLYSIDYEAYKYYTSPMIFIEENSDDDNRGYKNLLTYVGRETNEMPMGLYIGTYEVPMYDHGIVSLRYVYSCGYNEAMADNIMSRYTTVFPVESFEEGKILKNSDEILNYFKNYKASYVTGTVRDKYSADLFQPNEGQFVGDPVDIKEFGDLPSYADSRPGFGGWLEGVADYGIFYKKSEHDESVYVQKIQSVNLSDFVNPNFSKDFFVSEADVDDLSQYVMDNSLASNTYLFHFGFDDDYYSALGKVVREGGDAYDILGVVTPVYLDFDILTLRFSDDGKNITTFGVFSSPIDVVPDVEMAQQGNDKLFSKEKKDWLRNIIAIILGVLLFVVVIRFMSWLFPKKQYMEMRQQNPPWQYQSKRQYNQKRRRK